MKTPLPPRAFSRLLAPSLLIVGSLSCVVPTLAQPHNRDLTAQPSPTPTQEPSGKEILPAPVPTSEPMPLMPDEAPPALPEADLPPAFQDAAPEPNQASRSESVTPTVRLTTRPNGGTKAQLYGTVTVNDTKQQSVRITLSSGRLLNLSNGILQVKPGTPASFHFELPGTPEIVKITAKQVNNGSTVSTTVQTIRLDSVFVAYHANSPYPFNNEMVKIRAFVRATARYTPDGLPVQKIYSDTAFATDTEWWNTGNRNGSTTSFSNPENVPVRTQISAWPTTWPALRLDWVNLYHQASPTRPRIPYSRIYSYRSQPSPWNGEWSADRNNLSRGMTRYRVTVIMHAGTNFKIPKTSRNNEFATRIAVRDHALPSAYTQMASAFLNTPYGWGGQWFGGTDSGGRYLGSPGSNTYGIDCSGLVGSAAVLTGGYNIGTQKYGTGTLHEVTDVIPPSERATVGTDDVLNWPYDSVRKVGGHTVIIVSRDDDDLDIIQSSPLRVNRERISLQSFITMGYKTIRLRPR